MNIPLPLSQNPSWEPISSLLSENRTAAYTGQATVQFEFSLDAVGTIAKQEHVCTGSRDFTVDASYEFARARLLQGEGGEANVSGDPSNFATLEMLAEVIAVALDVALSTRASEATLATRASEATLATRASEATLQDAVDVLMAIGEELISLTNKIYPPDATVVQQPSALSGVIVAGPAVFWRLTATQTAAGQVRWLQVFDAAATPTAGAACKVQVQLPGVGGGDVDIDIPFVATTGIAWAVSTTPNVYTAAAIVTAAVIVRYK